MKPCVDHHDTLLMAAFGELDPEQLLEWERHTAVCPGCRKEYQALLRLLGQIKESMPVPELSEKRTNSILRSVTHELKKEKGKLSWKRRWFASPGRLLPALATACLVLITIGWLGINLIRGPDTRQESVGPMAENQAMVGDLEVIRNIEFLEEMDTLQELVSVLDRHESI